MTWSLRRWVAAWGLAVLLGCGGGAQPDPHVELDLPASYDGHTPVPLVVYLHGYFHDGSDPVFVSQLYWDLAEAANTRGVIIAVPRGAPDTTGNFYWNGAGCCGNAESPDHVAALRAVVTRLESEYAIDPDRVYFMGHSNGGFMSHRMACEASDVVAAVASLAGDVWARAELCQPSEHVSVLQMHGTADDVVPYEGNTIWAWPSATWVVDSWGTRNGCSGELTPSGTLDLVPGLPGAETTRQSHACPDAAVELWSIAGAGHVPPFAQPVTTLAVLDWLLAHPKS